MAKGAVQTRSTAPVETVTQDDIWSEIDAYAQVDAIRPDDITTAKMRERYGCNPEKAVKFMRQAVADHPERWEMLKLSGRSGNTWVLRRRV